MCVIGHVKELHSSHMSYDTHEITVNSSSSSSSSSGSGSS